MIAGAIACDSIVSESELPSCHVNVYRLTNGGGILEMNGEVNFDRYERNIERRQWIDRM
jgi:hypothetical protein